MNPHKIMIVEDESLVALEMKKILENKGYEVPAIFNSGEKALAIIEALAPDLILMDMRLQGKMDGIETTRQILVKYDVPIVFITAYSEQSLVDNATLTEPYGYILKPFSAVELLITVQVALHKHKIDKEKKQLIEELKQLTEELKRALERVKLLSGFLPICCTCKKIRDDKGGWQQIESFISDHSEAVFSHGICPDCFKQEYPGVKLAAE